MSHYEVLGISPLASADAIRRAYRQRAREVHPDRQAVGPGSSADSEHAGRVMQDLNEAWRVLGDPCRRASYDQLLLRGPDIQRRPPAVPEDDGYDQPFPHRLAEPGDVGIAIVRSLPWVAVVAVLGAIFVFTAFAGDGADDPISSSDLVGSCVVLRKGGEVATVPCDGPSDGRVDLIAARSSL
ncbi:MAG TPA: J domain-containing protein, partial [Acidimicrobiales bacterium]|nr:J domain-containing protein [Acidimicrobiales bacterium]